MARPGYSKNIVAVRDPSVGLIVRNRELIVVSSVTSVLHVQDVEEVLALLERLMVPTAIESVARRQRALIESLVSAGAILVLHQSGKTLTASSRHAIDVSHGAAAAHRSDRCSRLVVAATGAIQSFLLPKLLHSAFLPFARIVDVILTDGGQHFVTKHAIQAMGARVWTEIFATGDAPVPHIELAKADLVVVYPASAATLHRLASGACSDLVSLVAAATAAPVMVVPAMNGRMWSHPPIRRNVLDLIDNGTFVVVPTLMHEVAAGIRSQPIYGGAGVGSHNLVASMASVLAHGAKPRARNSATRA